MADEILGHENLDHGKHLKHHAHKPKPGERFGRGSRPAHVALGKTKAHAAHDHAHEDHAKAHVEHTHAAHAQMSETNWRVWGIGLAIAIVAAFFLVSIYPALAAVLFVLILNTAIEYHKRFTPGAPLDVEILYVSAAYLSCVYGFGWGVLLALIGPALAEASRAEIHSHSVITKAIGVLIAAGTGAILSATVPELIFAVLLGNIAQYLGLFVINRTNGILSVVRRLTTIGFGAYVIAFILPHLVRLG